MGQVLHGSATTTAAVRRAIQNSQESLRVLAGRYGIKPKTVANWTCRVYIPVSELIYAAFRSNAKGLLPPNSLSDLFCL